MVTAVGTTQIVNTSGDIVYQCSEGNLSVTQHLQQFLLRHTAMNSVRAQYETVAFYIGTLNDIHFQVRLHTQGPRNDIRLGRQSGLLFGNHLLLDQFEHHRMVVGAEYFPPAPNLIDTAVADMSNK